tara:strand:+ start:1805 stop:1966 length:162 start_codon:yes stop_codon:yes gene_type:complete
MKIVFNKVYDADDRHIASIHYGKLRVTKNVSSEVERKLNLIAKKLNLKFVKNE